MSKTLRLYDIPRDSKIKCDQGIITFHHLDGMYSYCTVDWAPDGKNVAHLSATQPLEKR